MTGLFARCVLPGCRQLVAEPGDACPAWSAMSGAEPGGAREVVARALYSSDRDRIAGEATAHTFIPVNHSSIGPEDHCLCGFRPRGWLAWGLHFADVLVAAGLAMPDDDYDPYAEKAEEPMTQQLELFDVAHLPPAPGVVHQPCVVFTGYGDNTGVERTKVQKWGRWIPTQIREAREARLKQAAIAATAATSTDMHGDINDADNRDEDAEGADN